MDGEDDGVEYWLIVAMLMICICVVPAHTSVCTHRVA